MDVTTGSEISANAPLGAIPANKDALVDVHKTQHLLFVATTMFSTGHYQNFIDFHNVQLMSGKCSI